MSDYKKVLIIGGITLAVIVGGAYLIYRIFSNKEIKDSDHKEEEKKEVIEEKKKSVLPEIEVLSEEQDIKHTDLIVVLDEVMVESIDNMIKIYEMIAKLPTKEREMKEEDNQKISK